MQSQAMRSGLTLTEFAIRALSNAIEPSKEERIEESLSKLEATLENFKEAYLPLENSGLIGSIREKQFTDQGAKAYSIAAINEFKKHAAIKGLSVGQALDELADITAKYQGDLELITQILIGHHELTGLEMSQAVKATGNCPMMKTLQDWSRDPLLELGKAFVNAMEV